MIIQSDRITSGQVTEAMDQLREKKNPLALDKMRFDSYDKGLSAQIMHIGPYSKEGPTIMNIHRFAEEQSHRSKRKHHEIYLSDPYRTKPENLRTVIRQLVTKQWPCLSVSTGLTGKSL